MIDTSMEVVLGIPFLAFLNTDKGFAEKDLGFRSYMATEALSPSRKLGRCIEKRVAAAAFEREGKMLGVYNLLCERLAPMQSLLISLMGSDKSLLMDKRLSIPTSF